ncbi:MAG TPA: HEAT repeat domain-containing protein [Gemmataceae bacterium]|nr:HEAT repeat domain-containing protein [Gemmataceae bacterium]
MMYAPLVFLLLAQPGAAKAPGRAARPDAPAVATDDQILKSVFVDTSGPDLLAFFRQRMTPSVDAEHVAKLTGQLSDNSPEVHAKAMAELVGLGPLAVPALRRAVNHADNEETLSRARKCLQAIEGAGGSAVVQSAIRALAAYNSVEAADTLVQFLPFTDDETVIQEIETTLLAIGMREGKAESALMRALTDAVPIRRGFAARVLCQVGGRAERAAVRPLLKDAKPSVRMMAALSLTDLHDAEAMNVLIDIIAVLPPEGRKRVEEYLSELAGEWAVKTPQGSDAVSGRLRRELWSTWWNSLDDKQLLDEFRSRTLTEEERGRVLELIGKLSDASADVRAKTAETLIGMGPRITSLLRQIMEQRGSGPANERLMELAQQCLSAIEGGSGRPLPEAATRLLALRQPRGTIETLLAYVPFAESETIAEQLVDVLVAAGCSGGKADPALVRALEDKSSVRRSAAAEALCKGLGGLTPPRSPDVLPAVRKLLGDADVTVRLRTAVALAHLGDKSAVPALIALLADLPLDQVWEVEEILATLAGDNAPTQRVGSDKKSRTASVDAWKAWWKKEEKNVDLARLNDSERGSNVLLAVDMQAGKVLEVTRNGRIRWQIQGPQWPWDAVVCRNGNIFVAQQHTNQVSMWSRQGKELWQRPCNMPFYCQQLRNGHLFVVCRQQIAEFDINGKEVSSQQLMNLNWIVGGCKFPNGHVGLFNQMGQYVRLDATGKQVKTYQANLPGRFAMNAEVLPGDRVVAALNIGRVAEYNDKGKGVWECNVVNPAVPHRLPNGHTLVAQNGMNHLYELDRKGKIVSEKKDLEFHPWRIRRR